MSSLRHRTDRHHTFCVTCTPFIGDVVLAVYPVGYPRITPLRSRPGKREGSIGSRVARPPLSLIALSAAIAMWSANPPPSSAASSSSALLESADRSVPADQPVPEAVSSCFLPSIGIAWPADHDPRWQQLSLRAARMHLRESRTGASQVAAVLLPTERAVCPLLSQGLHARQWQRAATTLSPGRCKDRACDPSRRVALAALALQCSR